MQRFSIIIIKKNNWFTVTFGFSSLWIYIVYIWYIYGIYMVYIWYIYGIQIYNACVMQMIIYRSIMHV